MNEKLEKKKRVVVALGGNALGNTLPEQMIAAKNTAKAIVDLVEEGYQVVITHGNGPQVGMINHAMAALSREDPTQPNTPLSVCVAMSQSYIGYDLQNALREELINRHIENVPVSTMVTQVLVDGEDPAFSHPNKPIGKYVSKEEAAIQAENYGHVMKDFGKKGYRRIVASPSPKKIIEIGAIRSLIDQGEMVICCGGGGIPVTHKGDNNALKGASAVIDKDLVSALLAEEIDADLLIILTAVEKVAIHYGTPKQIDLSKITVDQAEEYIKEGYFEEGSMLPKMRAAISFASSGKERAALITLLDKAREGIRGETGTRIY